MTIADYFAIGVLIILALWGVARLLRRALTVDQAIHQNEADSRTAFVGHSYDRARNRVYHCLLLLGSHSGYWRRRLN
jgi:hypothetical protein